VRKVVELPITMLVDALETRVFGEAVAVCRRSASAKARSLRVRAFPRAHPSVELIR
jgi:hypothetical protein